MEFFGPGRGGPLNLASIALLKFIGTSAGNFDFDSDKARDDAHRHCQYVVHGRQGRPPRLTHHHHHHLRYICPCLFQSDPVSRSLDHTDNINGTIDAIILPKEHVLAMSSDVLLENKDKLSLKASDPIQADIVSQIPLDIYVLNTPKIQSIHSRNSFRMGTSPWWTRSCPALWAFTATGATASTARTARPFFSVEMLLHFALSWP